mmetsp:Transcript_30244/g.44175  ORF Transcript_30244/g.44175 Transcript_30244/m.44175 type:complete len:217 (-) Transcript_30244:311-961(-)
MSGVSSAGVRRLAGSHSGSLVCTNDANTDICSRHLNRTANPACTQKLATGSIVSPIIQAIGQQKNRASTALVSDVKSSSGPESDVASAIWLTRSTTTTSVTPSWYSVALYVLVEASSRLNTLCTPMKSTRKGSSSKRAAMLTPNSELDTANASSTESRTTKTPHKPTVKRAANDGVQGCKFRRPLRTRSSNVLSPSTERARLSTGYLTPESVAHAT